MLDGYASTAEKLEGLGGLPLEKFLEHTLYNTVKCFFAYQGKNCVPIWWVVEQSNVNCISKKSLPRVFQ